MKDILLVSTDSGFDFELNGNDLAACESIENIVPMYLFGGNWEQDTGDGDEQSENLSYWGNVLQGIELYNSSFERTMNDVVLNSSGISKLIEAAETDLAPLRNSYDFEVSGNVPMPTMFVLDIKFSNGRALSYTFKNSRLVKS
jgi:hypothetical protein